MSPWFLLVVAGLLEVVWALSLKATMGFTRLGPSLLFGVSLAGSMILLALAMKHLPVGTAYAVWVGIGAAGAAIAAAFLYQEPVSPLRAMFLVLLIGSIIGLKWTA